MTEYAVIDGQRVALTDWFPAEVKPVCVGVYEADNGSSYGRKWYSYWDGKQWGYADTDHEVAFLLRGEETEAWDLFPPAWRGLSQPSGTT